MIRFKRDARKDECGGDCAVRCTAISRVEKDPRGAERVFAAELDLIQTHLNALLQQTLLQDDQIDATKG